MRRIESVTKQREILNFLQWGKFLKCKLNRMAKLPTTATPMRVLPHNKVYRQLFEAQV